MVKRIAYLTSYDPFDRKNLSGVPYYQLQTLKKHFNVSPLGPINSLKIELTKKLLKSFFNIFPKKYKISHSLIVSKMFGSIFTEKLKNKNYDYIFVEKGACETGYLKTKIPIIYSTDATFAGLLGYYDTFSNLYSFSVNQGNLLEKRIIDKAKHIICASHWVAQSVVSIYGADPKIVHVIPYGANLDSVPPKATDEEINKRLETCNLLFVGIDYKRKGLEIAYQTLVHLRSLNIKAKLLVVGSFPVEYSNDEDVELIGFINKNEKEGREKFDFLMRNSTFFFLPTRAEAQGIVFCEASAYGLPSITTNTGGVSDVVTDDINGYALPYNATSLEYAEIIKNTFLDHKKYREIVISTQNQYDKLLNWDAWFEQLIKIIA